MDLVSVAAACALANPCLLGPLPPPQPNRRGREGSVVVMAVSELSDAFPELKPGSTERDQNTIKTMQHAGVDLNDNNFWME